MSEREGCIDSESEKLAPEVPGATGQLCDPGQVPFPLWVSVSVPSKITLSLSSLPALTFYTFPFQCTWVWLFQENVKPFKGQASMFARHLLSLFSWSCLHSCPGDFLQCMRFLISLAIFPCLHWLTVAEIGHCFFKQIRSPRPTGISCLQEPPFTRYQLFENICVLPHQNNLLISNYFFSSNIIFFPVIIEWGWWSFKSKYPMWFSW